MAFANTRTKTYNIAASDEEATSGCSNELPILVNDFQELLSDDKNANLGSTYDDDDDDAVRVAIDRQEHLAVGDYKTTSSTNEKDALLQLLSTKSLLRIPAMMVLPMIYLKSSFLSTRKSLLRSTMILMHYDSTRKLQYNLPICKSLPWMRNLL